VEDPTGTPLTQDTYYNQSWQALEVRHDGDPDPIDQYIWDPRYVDAVVVRFHDGNTDGDYADGGTTSFIRRRMRTSM
jgi:hypothetical protein